MRAVAAVAVIVSVLVVSGCASSGAKTPTTVNDLQTPVAVGSKPSSTPLVVPLSPKAMRSLKQHLYSARFLSSTRLGIPGIAGSSNCPSVPVSLIVRSPHAIRVDLVIGSWSRTALGRRVRVPHSPNVCLDDLVPTPVVIAINPKQIDVHHRLKVSLYYPKGVIRRYKRPVVFTVPPLARARVREEVRVARASNRLFSIFSAVPGKEICAIPHNTRRAQDYRGICQTSVHPRPTMEPSVSVTFTENWGPSCPPGADCPAVQLTRHHTWQVIEGETSGPPLRIYVTRSSGATAPQDYK
jgi:hypothetical protein